MEWPHGDFFEAEAEQSAQFKTDFTWPCAESRSYQFYVGSWLLLWSPLTRPSPGWNRAKLRCHCNSLKVEHGRSTWNLRSNRIDIDSTGIDWRFLTQVDKGTIDEWLMLSKHALSCRMACLRGQAAIAFDSTVCRVSPLAIESMPATVSIKAGRNFCIADFGTTPIFAAPIPSTWFAQTWDLECAFFSCDVYPVCNFKIERGFKLFPGGLLLSSAFSNYLVVGLNLRKLSEKLFSFHGTGKSFTRCWGLEMSYMKAHFGSFWTVCKMLKNPELCLSSKHGLLYSKPEASLSRFQSNKARNNKYFWTDRQMIVVYCGFKKCTIWHVLSSALPSKII